MTRTQVYLTPQQHRALKREAEREGVSMTEVLRRILDQHLLGRRTAGRAPKKDLILSFVCLGESGRTDVSANHDRALDEALRAGPPR
ncbi:MAG TPA: CopG family transcriptional regulator [Planctomycetota bacterium]|nr:CopG family transcriptional regulator [Planctomycetota bacterium]